MARKPALELPGALERFQQASLLAMLASGYLAVAFSGELDAASLVVGAGALLARLLHLSGVVRISIGVWWVNAAASLYLLCFPVDYFFISRDLTRATVHMVIFIAAAKLLAAASRRDAILLGIIAFLEILAASVLSTNLTFLFFLVPFLAASLAALASSEIRRSMLGREVVRTGTGAIGRRLGLLTALSGTVILLLTAALFFVLPRTARSAMERLLPASQRISGFAPEVELGRFGTIVSSRKPAMHVMFEGERAVAGLHWRGSALGEFDGRKWYNSPAAGQSLPVGGDGLVQLVSDDQRRRTGRRMTYEVVLDGPSDYLFFAGLPENLRIGTDRLVRTPSGSVKLPFGQDGGLRYVVYSFAGDREVVDEAPPLALSPDERNFYLRLPPVDSRVGELARAVATSGNGDNARAQAIEQYLRTRFTYSLDASSVASRDPLADFLFVRKKGYCEYFASAMAVMLRELWIPARVVTGYLGGAPNPLTKWMVVRASDAHAWVEAWIPGQGWTTFDPTPSSGDGAPGSGLLARINMYVDAADTFWQEWVVGYDLDQQLTLAFGVDQSRRLGVPWLVRAYRRAIAARLPGAGRPVPVSGLLLALVGLAVGALLFRRRIAAYFAARGRTRPDAGSAATVHEAARLYRRMLAALHKRGIRKPPFQTAGEFVSGLPDSSVRPLVAEFTIGYESVRFGENTGEISRLADLLRSIEALLR
jgi:protein-glutamine gamma-glutamyltransferase